MSFPPPGADGCLQELRVLAQHREGGEGGRFLEVLKLWNEGIRKINCPVKTEGLLFFLWDFPPVHFVKIKLFMHSGQIQNLSCSQQ